MAKVLLSIIVVTVSVIFGGCNALGAGFKGGDSCIDIANPAYHINYFEMCGNDEEPVAVGHEKSVTLWVDVTSPASAGGKMRVKDLYLERSDQPGVNMLKNASFADGLWTGRKNNPMCLADDSDCRNIRETDDRTVWIQEKANGSVSCAVADMSGLGQGQQTHIFHPLINIEGVPKGVKFKAHGYIMVQGDIQVRLGLDIRGMAPTAGQGSGYFKRAVNGIIRNGSTSGKWIRLDLR